MTDAANGRAPAPVRRRSAVFLSAALLVLCAVFCALGVWQVQRREWKLALIERVEARVHGAPIPAPGPDLWPSLSRETSEYLAVTATGHFLNDQETLVQAVSDLGAGYWVLTPFVTQSGFTLLVNRGFVPHDQRTRADRAAGEIPGTATINGLLRLSEPGGGFLRSNDPANDRWYSRDVAAIAARRGLETAPYFVDADATPNAGGLPVGGLTVILFANNHLGYALTWFALAAMSVAGAVLVWRRRV